MICLTPLIVYFICFGSAQTRSTTDWRGLSPIISTRMDVERTLGPRNLDDEQLTYRFPDVVVVFYFTSNPNCREKLAYTSWDVTADRVTAIEVNLRRPPLVSDTGLDLTKFKKVKGDLDLVDRYHYLNDDNSFAIKVDNKYVAGYNYMPGSKHANLRCEPTSQH